MVEQVNPEKCPQCGSAKVSEREAGMVRYRCDSVYLAGGLLGARTVPCMEIEGLRAGDDERRAALAEMAKGWRKVAHLEAQLEGGPLEELREAVREVRKAQDVEPLEVQGGARVDPWEDALERLFSLVPPDPTPHPEPDPRPRPTLTLVALGPDSEGEG